MTVFEIILIFIDVLALVSLLQYYLSFFDKGNEFK